MSVLPPIADHWVDMASIQRNTMNQQVTWWSVTPDGAGGDLFAAPVLAKCRWEDKSELYIGQIDRREHVSKSVVVLDRPVAVGDYLALDDQTLELDPSTLNGAHKIQRFQQLPDLRNLEVVNKAIL